MASEATPPFTLRETDSHWVVAFSAMASPCEVHARCADRRVAEDIGAVSCAETGRIEAKFSRYRDDSVVQTINRSDGARIAVDDETARLLRYAGRCYELSEGRFDVSSGVLRRAWVFDGREASPDTRLIESLLERVGWSKIEFDGSAIRVPPGMEIDLGGIGKEYAADRVADLVGDLAPDGAMVNLGGDIRAMGPQSRGIPWTIGIEDPEGKATAIGQLCLANGGVATSGDSRRFCYVDGVRLGHILDPRTGWPVAGAPRSATVVGETCTAAGFLATLAMLHGAGAEEFLDAQDVTYHCVR